VGRTCTRYDRQIPSIPAVFSGHIRHAASYLWSYRQPSRTRRRTAHPLLFRGLRARSILLLRDSHLSDTRDRSHPDDGRLAQLDSLAHERTIDSWRPSRIWLFTSGRLLYVDDGRSRAVFAVSRLWSFQGEPP